MFANADRDVVVSYSDGQEHSRVAGHRRLKALLMDAGLDDDAAESDVHALHSGRILVLVTLGAVSEDRPPNCSTAPSSPTFRAPRAVAPMPRRGGGGGPRPIIAGRRNGARLTSLAARSLSGSRHAKAD